MKPEQQPYSLSMSEKILKADLQQEWLALNEELNKHNYLYHSIDSPEITDFQYDEMKKRLIFLEKSYFLQIIQTLTDEVCFVRQTCAFPFLLEIALFLLKKYRRFR